MVYKFTKLMLRTALFSVFLFTMVDCGSNNSSNTATTTSPTFTSLYTTVFSVSCVTCHTPGGNQGGAQLDFSSQANAYQTLMGTVAATNEAAICSGVSIVSPGNTSVSYILPVLIQADYQTNFVKSGCTPSTVHLQSAPMLNTSEASALTTWIQQGAANN